MSDTPANVEEKLTVRLAPALLERVDRAARDRGLRRSEFVRQALAAHVEQTLGPGDAISLYDVLEPDRVIGRFSGPSDLSVTPRDALRARIRARARRAKADREARPESPE